MSFMNIEVAERIKNSHVLIVDDAEFNRAIIEEILQATGVKNITSLDSAAACLNHIDTHRTDIIILDLMMPGMDGFSCIQKIRENSKHCDTPIIVQTAMGNPEERLRAFQIGANDLLTKPINPYELISRFKQHMSYQHVLSDLRNYQERVQEELGLARAMQQSMLPEKNVLEALAGSHKLIAGSVSQSSSELGGDLWGIAPISRSKIAVWMFDVAGHGVAAAINAVRVHTLFEAAQLQIYSPGKLLGLLNEQLCDHFSPGEFSTFFVGVIDCEENMLRYSVAACTESLVHHRESETVTCLAREGFPLGIKTDATYEDEAIAFHAGDTLLLYSDALTETTLPDSNEFIELEDVQNILKKHLRSSSAPISQLQQRTIYEMMHKIGANDETSLDDDLTVVLLTRDLEN